MTIKSLPTSKTRLLECMRTLNTELILAGLEDKPELLTYRDDKGRNWLHLCAGVNDSYKQGVEPADAIALAKGLMDRGLDVHEPAFTEGSWQAMPLWFAVSRGRNIESVRFLLGAAEHCIWGLRLKKTSRCYGCWLMSGHLLRPLQKMNRLF